MGGGVTAPVATCHAGADRVLDLDATTGPARAVLTPVPRLTRSKAISAGGHRPMARTIPTWARRVSP
ncbi:hypothetical protein [Alloactinosynnema sp. L-07]|nr:hypothetical protein [Alloactinosynnema sp. L-07]